MGWGVRFNLIVGVGKLGPGFSGRCWRCQARSVGGVRSVCVSGPERGTGQGASPQDPPAPTCVGYPPFGIFRYASKPGNDTMEKAH